LLGVFALGFCGFYVRGPSPLSTTKKRKQTKLTSLRP
jgi:hypothetical protein